MAKSPKDRVYVRNTGAGPIVLAGRYLNPGETRQVYRFEVQEARRFHPDSLPIQGESEEEKPAPVEVSVPAEPPAPAPARESTSRRPVEKAVINRTGKQKKEAASPPVDEPKPAPVEASAPEPDPQQEPES